MLPALYLLLVVTLAFAVVFFPGEVARLRSDALAAFGYVANWHLILGHESYFEAVGRPSLLKHLWSLAVEEQFYLLWPPLLALAISLGASRWRHRRALFVALAGAAASALLMAILYRPDVDPSRVYFGTDTRATGLLIGAALALVWQPARASAIDRTSCSLHRIRRRGRFWRRWGWTAPLVLDAAGVVALGGLVFLCLRLGEFQPFLYRGGFASVALTTAVAIMAVVHPYTKLGTKLLGWGPLRWIGLRSYGIYLWHWPVFMITRPQLDVPIDGLSLLALRLAATVLLAHLSYHYVETPIRRGALERVWKALREAQGLRRWELGVRWAGATVPAVVLCAVLSVAVAHAKPPEPPSYLSSTKAIHTKVANATPESAATLQKDSTDVGATATEEKRHRTSEQRTKARRETAEKKPSRSGTAVAATGPVSAIGDSVMLGAAGELQRTVPNLTVIDAEVGLQVAPATDTLRWRRNVGQLGDVVIVHLGSNGIFTTEQFDEMMRVLAGVDRVVFVNVNVPRAWEQPNNAVLAEGVQRYDDAVLVDWYSASVNHPEYFAPDGIHIERVGQRVYADLIAEQVEASRSGERPEEREG